MTRFGTALGVELRKTLTTRMWWILLVVMAVYVAAIAAFLTVAFSQGPGATGGPSPAGLDDATERLVLYTLVMPLAYVFPVLVGTLSITTEYRYKTLTPTFLAEPRRGLVLAAKLLVATVLGLLFGLVGTAAGAGAVAAVRVASGDPAGLDGTILQALAQVVLGMGLWAAVGVGVGALVRNQVAAVVVIIAFSQLVEPIARVALSAWEATRSVSQYLPRRRRGRDRRRQPVHAGQPRRAAGVVAGRARPARLRGGALRRREPPHRASRHRVSSAGPECRSQSGASRVSLAFIG